jgi:phosphoglucosamine mutase
MISASHNPFHDNGIKLFGPDGYKLSDEVELAIEQAMDDGMSEGLAAPEALGRATRLEDAQGRYIEFVKNTFPKGLRLGGLKVVVDCAHGAAYRVAPTVLWELEADVVDMAVTPDGFNINKDCGSTASDLMRAKVVEESAHVGIALDGDADRVVISDENGDLIDGDQVMALIAENLNMRNELKGGGVVATVMSNLGLERYLTGLGLDLARTKVGDRYVVEHMRAHGYNLGGEQSGHIVFGDHATTGDGLIAALQVLAVIAQDGRPASEVCRRFAPVPQLLKNVRYGSGRPLDDPGVRKAIADGENRLNGCGRLLIRPSGTEPLIRVMAEGDDEVLVADVVDDIVGALTQVAG